VPIQLIFSSTVMTIEAVGHQEGGAEHASVASRGHIDVNCYYLKQICT